MVFRENRQVGVKKTKGRGFADRERSSLLTLWEHTHYGDVVKL